MKHSLFPRLQGAFDGCPFDIEVEVTGQQVGQYHGGQQVDSVAWLSVNLLSTARNSLGRLLLWVVLFLDDHTEPEREMRGTVPSVRKTSKSQ